MKFILIILMSGFIKYNQDKSFYQVESSDVAVGSVAKNVKSLTINEEQAKLITGTIVLRDDNQSYSRVFRPFAKIKISWGFKDPLKALENLAPIPRNPVEIRGPSFRENLEAFLIVPGGSMNQDGTGEFIINFKAGLTIANENKTRSIPIAGTPVPPTKGLAITQILIESGIPAPYVNFKEFSDDITKAPLKQTNESNFAFLRRKANQWKKEFQVGITPAGIPAAIFCDRDKAENAPFSILTTGGVGLSHLFEYKSGIKNVISATWENNFINDGTGDHIQISVVGPGFTFTNKSVAETQTVAVFKLDEIKLKKEMERITKQDGLKAAQDFQKTIINPTSFQDKEIKQFWTSSQATTAPQGGGNKVNIETFGNTLYSPPNRVVLHGGWPDHLLTIENLKIRKVQHVLNNNGYRNKIEIVDRFFI